MNVASQPSSLRAELAEAKAEIGRLERELAEELAHQKQAGKDYSNVVGPMIRERDAMKPIVEAATALVAAHTGPVSLSRDAEKAQAMLELIRAVKVAAVEEGNKP